MDTPTRNFQRGDIRVSDAERDQAVTELGEHYQSGRLTLEEFDDRSSRALRAQTGNDLRSLFADLPRPAPVVSTPVSPAVPEDLEGPRGGLPIARAVIAFVIAAIVLGNAAGNHGHHIFGWIVPVVILGLVFLRLSRRHRRL
jgi:uncharacterized protein DUF1707